MKLSEVPDQYKVFTVKMSNGDKFTLTGTQKNSMLESSGNLLEKPDGSGFNRSFVVSWALDNEATRENVSAHAEEIKKALVKVI